MLRQLVVNVIQTRGIKHSVNIKWVKPEYIAAYKPERSGDLEPVPPIPDSTLGIYYSLSEEIKDASEEVKKIFSVGFLGKKEYNETVKKLMIDRVKRHDYDENTAETRIARLTGIIRYLQENMENMPKNLQVKVALQELIDKRKKLLKFLRQYDYKKFEWLLEKLNIEYKAHPASFDKLTRKQSLRKLTEMHCEDIRNNKLADYRNLLESQQGPFLKQKLETLNFIRSEQMELELPVTVTEKDIKKVENQYEEWKVRDEIKQAARKKRRNLITTIE